MVDSIFQEGVELFCSRFRVLLAYLFHNDNDLAAIAEFESGNRGVSNRNGVRIVTTHFWLTRSSGEERVDSEIISFVPADYHTAMHRH